ncbi:hypothetical protein DPMN_111475 [Dreissena polymorpha]|uniref:Uncharacterized protein n=1 Tax=Dreissena polymorpha TaxID=45954 RepID=A0A9D4KEP4_DREPO|nr:hypothetical protein DPMN_111475 [Dreissena polymorpha]
MLPNGVCNIAAARCDIKGNIAAARCDIKGNIAAARCDIKGISAGIILLVKITCKQLL